MNDSQHPGIRYTGYYPGVIGQITALHALFYHEHWGFDISFETQVARELSEFMRDFRKERDYFRAALVEGAFAGSIAIDGSKSGSEGARLRWFIVEPQHQGIKIGRELMDKAVTFCADAGHQTVFLWTFAGLDAARHLYESVGFRLVEQHDVEQWGQRIQEQKFGLSLPAGSLSWIRPEVGTS